MRTIALPALAILLASAVGHAAKAPMTREALEEQAAHVVRGTVLKVSTKVEKSKIENFPGLHKDTIHTITVRVDEVAKGTEITVLAWKPHTRQPLVPGLLGHEFIPKKGQTATFYLSGGWQAPLEPLLPNGIVGDTVKR